MTEPIQLGWKAPRIEMILSKGGDWIVTLEPVEGSTPPDYPLDTTVTLTVYNDLKLTSVFGTYPGVVEDPNVTFDIESELADLIPNGKQVRIHLHYPDATKNDFMWAKGKVVRDD